MKELFTVPEGTKVTEKMFVKVLVSSICSILLCMSCLAGTTWAWFAVSIENTGNVIEIGPCVKVQVDDSAEYFTNGATLEAGNHKIEIISENRADYFGTKVELYVTLYFGEDTAGYVTLNAANEYKATLKGIVEETALSWVLSWSEPDDSIREVNTNDISWLDEETTEDASDAADEESEESEESGTDENESAEEDSSEEDPAEEDPADSPAAESDSGENGSESAETSSETTDSADSSATKGESDNVSNETNTETAGETTQNAEQESDTTENET